jgi:hypothetical protein
VAQAGGDLGHARPVEDGARVLEDRAAAVAISLARCASSSASSSSSAVRAPSAMEPE